jgi:hypothetical protein
VRSEAAVRPAAECGHTDESSAARHANRDFRRNDDPKIIGYLMPITRNGSMQLSKRIYIIACAFVIAACGTPTPPAETNYDVVIRGGTVYDGTGGKPFVGDVAIRGERVVYVGPLAEGKGAKEIDARGKAVSPGFVNMLSWATESLLIDGRAQSNLRQGVTLEVFGEGATMGPLNPRMKEDLVARQGDLRYPVEWNTLGEFLEHLEKKGIAPNVASFVGAGTVRTHVLGEKDVQPTPEQLTAMRSLVRAAMEEGALGVGSGLQYMPDIYATTDELVALMEEAGRCGGMYITHMRSEGQYLLESIDETIEIARRSGTAAEIYHLKMSGQMYWNKLDAAIQRIEAARAAGVPVTADIYPYIASGTGLDVTMPPWVQEGGLDAWIARLKDPKIRKRVIAEMRAAKSTWSGQRDAGRLQDRASEAADRQDSGASCETARCECGGRHHRPDHRGWFEGQRSVLHDVRGESAAGDGVAVGKLQLGRGRAVRGRNISKVERASTRLRKLRPRTWTLRP